MAITQTGAIFKAFSFDGISSRSYGVYITGEAVYNAPERDVDIITIPGRNGSFALDNGRFENIEVTYPASIAANNEADFVQAVSDLRNFLCSKKGYCRLTDEYNPNEYRMAVYKSGLDVSPAQLRAGDFEIIFECKPQRYLTSGETATAVASGGTVTNPTLFESSPLLEVTGYGTIEFNGYEIEIENNTIGHIVLQPQSTVTTPKDTRNQLDYYSDYDYGKLNSGDTIKVGATAFSLTFTVSNSTNTTITSATVRAVSTEVPSINVVINTGGKSMTITGETKSTTATYPPTNSEKFYKYSYIDITLSDVNSGTLTGSVSFIASQDFYNGSLNNKVLARYIQPVTPSTGSLNGFIAATQPMSATFGEFTAESTVATFGNPTYIDCDIGEAYAINAGLPISLNQYIDLGSDLPTLASGTNEITYDNTITNLKVTPRWWKV